MPDAELPSVHDLRVDTIKGFRDARGVLFPAELPGLAGFAPVRLFWVGEVPAGTVRGGHGHRVCRQYLICATGRIAVAVFDGDDERRVTLDQGQAVLLPPGIWASEIFEEPGSLLLVLCDRAYEPDEYIRSRDDFVAYRAAAAQRSN